MEKLRADYLDLLLIHQPFGNCYGSCRADFIYERANGALVSDNRCIKKLSITRCADCAGCR